MSEFFDALETRAHRDREADLAGRLSAFLQAIAKSVPAWTARLAEAMGEAPD